jgi:hypothetical protein
MFPELYSTSTIEELEKKGKVSDLFILSIKDPFRRDDNQNFSLKLPGKGAAYVTIYTSLELLSLHEQLEDLSRSKSSNITILCISVY